MDDVTEQGPLPDNIALDAALGQLNGISARLVEKAEYAAAATLANLLGPPIILMVAVDLAGIPKAGIPSFLHLSVLTATAITALNVIILWQFNVDSRLGQGLMQEISDWVELDSRSSGKRLDVRLCLRRFLAAADLPFVPKSASGPLYYVVVNVAVLLFWIFMSFKLSYLAQ